MSLFADSLASTNPAVRIAVDVGGTTLKGAILSSSGDVLHVLTTPTFSADGDAFSTLSSLTSRLYDFAAERSHPVAGIGIASPGLIDTHRGRVTFAVNLKWVDLPLRDLLEAQFALPVFLDHDARAGAIAERASHPTEAEAYRNFLFVPIGTGIAAAVTSAGKLLEGATGGAGELGHTPAVTNGELCVCGQYGCVEVYVSATNLMTRYRARGGAGAQSAPELVQKLDVDRDAHSTWQDLVEALATGLSSLVAMLDPARIVIGGGLSGAGAHLLVPLRAALEARLQWRSIPPLVGSALGSHAGLIGAALSASSNSPHPDFTLRAAAQLALPELTPKELPPQRKAPTLTADG